MSNDMVVDAKIRWPGCSPYPLEKACKTLAKLAWPIITPLGFPVDPDV